MWWLVAHAVHLSLILLGTIGVVALLFPQWRENRRRRREVASQGGRAGVDEHAQRIEELRASARSNQLGVPVEQP